VLNVFDLFVAVVTIGLAVIGFREGLVRGAIKFAGFIALVILLTASIGKILAITDKVTFLPQPVAVLVVIVVLLVLGMTVLHIIAKTLHELVHMTPAGFIDNGLGAAFGILKSLLLCGLLAIVLSLAPHGGFLRAQYEQSVSAEHLVGFMSETVPFIRDMIRPYYHRLAPEPVVPEHNGHERPQSAPHDFI